MARWILLILIVLLCESPLTAQTGGTQSSAEPLPYSFKQFGNETWLFIQQPTKWEYADWLKLGAVGAGAYLLMATADQPVRDVVMKDQRYYKSVPIEFGRVWGELYTPIVLFSGFALYSLVADDPKARKIGYEIGQASLYAGAITYILKLSIGRSRPFNNRGPRSFRPFSAFFESEYHSLPGGHNAAAFVLSTVLSRNVEPTWLKIVAYIPAALTFISRIYQDKHWTSDDFAGAALGYFIATWVVDQHEGSPGTVEMSSMFPLSISFTF
jgi:hypothetical protein